MSTFPTITALLQRVRGKTRDFAPQVLAIKTAELLTDVRNRHGRYPGDVQWARLKPATVARKGKDTPLLDTASMRNAVQMKIEPERGEVYTDHEIALIHELGAHGKRTKIPARPIWQPAVKKLEQTLEPDLIRELVKRLASV